MLLWKKITHLSTRASGAIFILFTAAVVTLKHLFVTNKMSSYDSAYASNYPLWISQDAGVRANSENGREGNDATSWFCLGQGHYQLFVFLRMKRRPRCKHSFLSFSQITRNINLCLSVVIQRNKHIQRGRVRPSVCSMPKTIVCLKRL
jgi:hypothetical protein